MYLTHLSNLLLLDGLTVLFYIQLLDISLKESLEIQIQTQNIFITFSFMNSLLKVMFLKQLRQFPRSR